MNTIEEGFFWGFFCRQEVSSLVFEWLLKNGACSKKKIGSKFISLSVANMERKVNIFMLQLNVARVDIREHG